MSSQFYRSKAWRDGPRAFVLRRDGYRCAVPGCRARANYVDHVISREDGGSDHPLNLRSLCPSHDAQVKERRKGSAKRGRDGEFKSVCDRNGMPTDPTHPWYRKK